MRRILLALMGMTCLLTALGAFADPQVARVRLGLSRPTFGSDLEEYDTAYGKSDFMYFFGGEHYFLSMDWAGVFGLGARLGYYKDVGYALKPAEGGGYEADKQARTSLAVIPTQLVATGRHHIIGPWLTLNWWGGPEITYIQEVRRVDETDAAGGDTELYGNSLWKPGLVFGASLDILLNPLEPGSTQNLENVLNLYYAYLSPFIEIVQPLSLGGDAAPANKPSAKRTVIGAAFVFESRL